MNSSAKVTQQVFPFTHKIDSVLIKVDGAGDDDFFFLLTKHGDINRMGPGSNRMFIGKANPQLFAEMMKEFCEQLIEITGKTYRDPKLIGSEITLTLVFHAYGQEFAMAFVYDAASRFLPKELVQFVSNAVAVTESWHQQQQQMSANTNSGSDKIV